MGAYGQGWKPKVQARDELQHTGCEGLAKVENKYVRWKAGAGIQGGLGH